MSGDAQPASVPRSAGVGFQQQSGSIMALDWIMQNPSIPLEIRRRYHMMWENVILGNYDKRDIMWLMSKHREWWLDFVMSMAEQRWGNPLTFSEEDQNGALTQWRMDLNMLGDTLEQMFFIQLTRGKEGFTMKEMNTSRGYTKVTAEKEEGKKSGWRLF